MKLAIRGHSTRGKEVIELLKMIGGKNTYGYTGDMESLYFSIYNDTIIYGSDRSFLNDNYVFFTLEEFLEKYPFKVGDIVDVALDYVSCFIDGMRWNSEKCCVEYHLNYLNGSEYGWHVSECLNNHENEDVIIGPKVESTGFMQMGKTCGIIFNEANYEDEVELQLGNYEIAVRDGKYYAIRKKPKYPTTYEECCEILGIGSYFEPEIRNATAEECRRFTGLIRLKRCRDAYWKIAGKEMGLGKPWEPDWKDNYQKKWTISFYQGEINLTNGPNVHRILAFPAEEMRDVFYENFKDLIESCKELL